MSKQIATEYRRTKLPYGIWTEEDGAIVIFNRRYEPIWRKRGAEWEPIDNTNGKVWIKFVTQTYFYNDNDLGRERQLIDRLIALCTRMRIPVPNDK